MPIISASARGTSRSTNSRWATSSASTSLAKGGAEQHDPDQQ
jgi:hypothetical protein